MAFHRTGVTVKYPHLSGVSIHSVTMGIGFLIGGLILRPCFKTLSPCVFGNFVVLSNVAVLLNCTGVELEKHYIIFKLYLEMGFDSVFQF
jgi:hypothetical protein